MDSVNQFLHYILIKFLLIRWYSLYRPSKCKIANTTSIGISLTLNNLKKGIHNLAIDTLFFKLRVKKNCNSIDTISNENIQSSNIFLTSTINKCINKNVWKNYKIKRTKLVLHILKKGFRKKKKIACYSTMSF